MKRNDQIPIFKLVKTMDRGEKHFFNLFCNRQNNKAGKIYLKLFKAIDKQKKYDEPQLKNKLKNDGAQFTLTKVYLYKLVLEALVQYYTKNHLSLYDQLLKIKVLYEKGLLGVSQKMVYKVRKLAEEQNDYIIAMETITIERSLLLKAGTLTKKDVTALQQQNEHYTILNRELGLYKQLYDKVAFFEFKYGRMLPKDIEKESEFNKIAYSTLFKNTNKPGSTMSNWLLLCTRGIYYKILGDFEKSNREYFAAIKVLNSNSEFKKNYPDYVAQTLKGYIVSCIALKKFDLALQKLSELKTFCSLYSTIDTRMALLNLQSRELELYINTGRKNETMDLINEIEKKIKNGEMTGDSNKLAFYSNASITCTLFSEHLKSMYWINKILNFETAEKNYPNMYSAARIIQLINLAELQEYDLLSYRLKSFRRFLGKQASTYRYQEIFINFIRKILKGEYTKSNLLDLYKDVKKALVNLFKDPKEAQACFFFDFVGWFNSKIENMPYTTWAQTNNGVWTVANYYPVLL